MKIFRPITLLVILLVIFIGYSIYYTFSGSQYISAKDAKIKIKNNSIKHIIDVRTQAEWNLGQHTNAIHFPNGSINEESIKRVLPSFNVKKEDGILVYCNSGQRARKASNKLNEAGYKNVFYIAGHYSSIE